MREIYFQLRICMILLCLAGGAITASRYNTISLITELANDTLLKEFQSHSIRTFLCFQNIKNIQQE